MLRTHHIPAFSRVDALGCLCSDDLSNVPMINLRAFSSSLAKVSVSIYMHVTWVFVPGIEDRFAVHVCLCSYLINVSLDC